MTDLTSMQLVFVDELVASGRNPTEAARRAGYRHPGQEAYRLMRNPAVMAAVKGAQDRLIVGHGTNLAVKTLCDVMEDLTAPHTARVAAARCMLAAGGRFSSPDANDAAKPLHEMSYDELNAIVQHANDVIGGRMDEVPVAALDGGLADD